MTSFAFGDTIAQIDFDANTAFFTYPYAYGGGSASGGSAAGGNPGNGLIISYNSTGANTAFPGFGGGAGGANQLIRRPDAISDFTFSFDVNMQGIATPGNVDFRSEISFRYPDINPDGDDGGNNFSDYIFRVDRELIYNGVAGGWQNFQFNFSTGTVQTGFGAGGGTSNQFLTFAEFQNGVTNDPFTNPKSWANVTEIQVGFNVNNGQTALWGADNNNIASFDNFLLTQVNPVPEPVNGILSAILLGTVGLVRRRR